MNEYSIQILYHFKRLNIFIYDFIFRIVNRSSIICKYCIKLNICICACPFRNICQLLVILKILHSYWKFTLFPRNMY